MAAAIKRLFVGRALRTEQAAHERLTKKTALAVFSSDALSSTAYATEEILLVLAVAAAFYHSPAPFHYVVPISVGIATLLVIVMISYRQTIHAYPSGGGAYIVAKENLGTTPGLVAGAALLVDYVLTVSVSVAAGAAAITSAVQGTRAAWLSEHKIALCLVCIAFIAVANLRGVRESGALFAAPTYLFVFSFLFMIGFGFAPEARNASTTLVWMAGLLTVMFLGTSVMAYFYGVHPKANETVISQFARIIFTGSLGWCYYLVQAATAAILVLAANTSFADFPRLASLLARDRYLPRQFANRGDRLVFSNGILILAVFSSLLVVAFGGDTSRLIPLYAVGVFLSFTLSQAGMVRHWLDERAAPRAQPTEEARGRPLFDGEAKGDAIEPLPDVALDEEELHRSHFVTDEVTTPTNWRQAIAINGLGAVATFVVLCVFVVTKFIHGAWIVVLVIPLLVLLFRSIRKHYLNVARQLSTEGLAELRPLKHTVVVPISGIHRGVIGALQYAKSIAPENVYAVYVDFDEEATAKLRAKWARWGAGVNLVVLPSPYRELTRPLLRYISRLERRRDEDMITVVLPEFIPAKWWQHVLHNQSSLLLKGALLFKEGIIVTSVPYHLKH
jgi:amino acid transporter